MMRNRNRRFSGLMPRAEDTQDVRTLKTTALLVAGAVVFMLLAAAAAFFLTLKGPERVLVPNVIAGGEQAMNLIDAMVLLQEKGLYGRIQLKHSSAYGKGTVIDQRPRPGAVVKAGRRVTLTVSEGPVIDTVGDYVGSKLASLRIELKELFPEADDVLIRINEPVMYVHNEAEPGTVIEQSPSPGTPLREGEVQGLDLVVSRGPLGQLYATESFLGLPFREVMTSLAEQGVPFTFQSREAQEGEPDGVIVAQSPQPGERVPEGTVVELTMTEPERLPRGRRFGLFTAELIVYPIHVNMELVERSSTGDRTIVSLRHPGGMVSLPYVVDQESEVLFFVNGEPWN